MSRKGTICVVALGLALATPGFSDLVSVTPGTIAGPLPGTALDLTGHPYLTEITGTLDDTDRVAMFEIDITNPLYFSAYTVLTGGGGIPDPELALFNSSGQGVYMNDDVSSSPVDTQSCLPSSIAPGNPCPATSGGLGPLTPGNYFLALTLSGNTPLDASSSPIFSPVLSTDVVGPNGSAPIDSWDSGFSVPDFDLATYDIVISDAPEPAAWPVTAALSLALILFRRKLRTR